MTAARPFRLQRGTTDHVVARLFPKANPYLHDPVGWIRDRLGEDLWSKQREIADSVVANAYTAVPSCHAAGKSYLASRLVAWWVDVHPPGTAIAVTTASTAHQVNAVLWDEIKRAHEHGDLPGKITGGTGTAIPEWTVDGRRVAFGRKPDNPGAFQGIHRPYVLVIIDEAGEIEDRYIDTTSTIATGPDDRTLAIGNPVDSASRFARMCQPGSIWNRIQIPAWDTPKFTGETFDGGTLIDPSFVDRMRTEWGEDSWMFQARIHAEFPDLGDDLVFPPRLVQKAIDADLAGTEAGGYGADIAVHGDDESVVYRNRGGVLRFVDAWRGHDTEQSAGRLAAILQTHGRVSTVPMYVDAVGVGRGVYDKLRHQNWPVLPFNGGNSPTDREMFGNRRAETFWALRRAMEDGQVDLDPADRVLLDQLQLMKWRRDVRGRTFIESKDDMRARGVKSPDRADAASMAFVTPSGSILGDLRRQLEQASGGLPISGDILSRPL